MAVPCRAGTECYCSCAVPVSGECADMLAPIVTQSNDEKLLVMIRLVERKAA